MPLSNRAMGIEGRRVGTWRGPSLRDGQQRSWSVWFVLKKVMPSGMTPTHKFWSHLCGLFRRFSTEENCDRQQDCISQRAIKPILSAVWELDHYRILLAKK